MDICFNFTGFPLFVVHGENPPVGVVRKFVHLLDLGDTDYTEEIGSYYHGSTIKLDCKPIQYWLNQELQSTSELLTFIL